MRASFVAAASAYFLATLPNAGAEALLSHLTVGAHARLAEDGRKAVAQMGNQQRASADVLIMFAQAIEREQRRMRSFERFMPAPVDPMLRSRIADMEKGITSVWTSMGITSSPFVPAAERIRGSGGEDRRVPSRLRDGPLPTPEPPTAMLKFPNVGCRRLRARQLHRRQALDQRHSRCRVGGVRAHRPAGRGRLFRAAREDRRRYRIDARREIRRNDDAIAGGRPGGLASLHDFVDRPASRNQALPIVYVLSTGGTIAGQGSSSTDLSNYKPGTILGEQLVKAVPQIAQIADVKVEQIVNVNSSDITIEHWLTLAKRIQKILADDPAVAGFVITHGTNTLEETAYFLNLTVRSDKPVVLVGSMRPATAMSADGPLNLLNAVRTAIAPDAQGKGTLIVLNDEINAARDTTKTNTLRVETFRAPELGLLGYIDEDKVSFYRSTTKRHTANSEFDVTSLTQLPKVAILYSYVEPDASLIRRGRQRAAPKASCLRGPATARCRVEKTALKEVAHCRRRRGRRWCDRAASATDA